MGIKANSMLHRYPLPDQSQKAVLIASLVMPGGKDWRKFGEYLVRDGVGRDGGIGKAFDRNGAEVNLAEFIRANVESSETKRVWVITVSPEYGEFLNLSDLTVRSMDRIKSETGHDLKKAVFVEHHNRLHKHIHMIVPEGEKHVPLRIMRDGFKRFVQIEATKILGKREELSLRKSHELVIPSVGNQIEKRILDRMDSERIVAYGKSDTPTTYQEHSLIKGERDRLRQLAEIGLAKKLDYAGTRWRIDQTFERVAQMSQENIKLVSGLDVLNERGDVVPALHVVGGRDVSLGSEESSGVIHGKLVGIAVRDKMQENLLPARYQLLVEKDDKTISFVQGGPLGEGLVPMAMDYLGRSIEVSLAEKEAVEMRLDTLANENVQRMQLEERNLAMRNWDNEEQLMIEQIKKDDSRLKDHSLSMTGEFSKLCIESLIFAGIDVGSLVEGVEMARDISKIEEREHERKKEIHRELSRDEDGRGRGF